MIRVTAYELGRIPRMKKTFSENPHENPRESRDRYLSMSYRLNRETEMIRFDDDPNAAMMRSLDYLEWTLRRFRFLDVTSRREVQRDARVVRDIVDVYLAHLQREGHAQRFTLETMRHWFEFTMRLVDKIDVILNHYNYPQHP